MDRFSEGLNTATMVAEAFRCHQEAPHVTSKQKLAPAEFP
jgi:hypothetical protein